MKVFLEKSQLFNGEGQEKENIKNDYCKLIATAVDRSLNIYLKAIEGKSEEPENEKLLKISSQARHPPPSPFAKKLKLFLVNSKVMFCSL